MRENPLPFETQLATHLKHKLPLECRRQRDSGVLFARSASCGRAAL